jgi:hypothetical protein
VTEAADRFVRGAGEFSDHRRVEMATYAVVLRSPFAHAPDRVDHGQRGPSIRIPQ